MTRKLSSISSRTKIVLGPVQRKTRHFLPCSRTHSQSVIFMDRCQSIFCFLTECVMTSNLGSFERLHSIPGREGRKRHAKDQFPSASTLSSSLPLTRSKTQDFSDERFHTSIWSKKTRRESVQLQLQILTSRWKIHLRNSASFTSFFKSKSEPRGD